MSSNDNGAFWHSKWKRFVGVLLLWASLVTGLGAWGMMRLDDIQDFQRDEIEAVTARTCLRSWETRPEIRELSINVATESAKAANRTILVIARQVSDNPERLDEALAEELNRETERQLEPVINQIVDQYPDPQCDPESARETLEDYEEKYGVPLPSL